MHALIWLKCIGSQEANTSLNFWVNQFNIQGVINDSTHKEKLNFCQAYRLNRFEQQAENQYIARLNIRAVLLEGYKSIELETIEV